MLEKVELEVPAGMKQYLLADEDKSLILSRNALLLYPYILNKRISHGKAASILGVNKTDLIDLYAKIGLAYFDYTLDELDDDLNTLEQLIKDK